MSTMHAAGQVQAGAGRLPDFAQTVTLLQSLSEARGIAGQEDQVRAVIKAAIKDHVDNMRVDALGNLLAYKRGTGADRRRVMLDAHMDEVGFMVVKIEANGLLRIRKVGGWDDRLLASKVCLVGRDGIAGVIGLKAIHLLDADARKRLVKIEELGIDIGAASQAEVEKWVELGDMVTLAAQFEQVGGLLKGKAFDDRAGCAVVIEVLRGGPYPCDIVAAFTAQEEVGLRGAQVAAYDINPDLAFAFEGTIADDLPKEKDSSPTTELGKGPALSIMDHSAIMHRGLNAYLMGVAQELDIPYQFKQPGIGGTNVGRIHLARAGIPATVLSVPCRYIHSPAAMLHPGDLAHEILLMRGALERIAAYG
ncbi:MAG: M42 family metallopeptidase [Chloroflexi bacterium]|nr:M42 family metallopeptidase [Chloroflexota bacterium]